MWWGNLPEFILCSVNCTGKLYLGSANNPATDLIKKLNISVEEQCFGDQKKTAIGWLFYHVCFLQWHLTNGLYKCRCSVCPWSLPLLWGLYREGSAVLCPGTQNGSWSWESVSCLPCKLWALRSGLQNYHVWFFSLNQTLASTEAIPSSYLKIIIPQISSSK